MKKIIENRVVEVKAGCFIVNNNNQRELHECEVPEFAPFRLYSNMAANVQKNYRGTACKVEITGRTFVHKQSNYYVTVRVTTVVEEGEPETFSALMSVGWPGHLESAENV